MGDHQDLAKNNGRHRLAEEAPQSSSVVAFILQYVPFSALLLVILNI